MLYATIIQLINSLTYRCKFEDKDTVRSYLKKEMLKDLDLCNSDSLSEKKTEIAYYFLDRAKRYRKFASLFRFSALVCIFVFAVFLFLSFLFLSSWTLILIIFIVSYVLWNLLEDILSAKSWNSVMKEIECENLAFDFIRENDTFKLEKFKENGFEGHGESFTINY